MLAKRIIPCLDVRDGVVVKGVQFREHQVLGDVLDLAMRYRDQGADELVFYDIAASAEGRRVARDWVTKIARFLDIPFCVAGGIRTVEDAEVILNAGADKISINSPALERPSLIEDLAKRFGSQCVVVGVDSKAEADGHYVYQYTGIVEKMKSSRRKTTDWLGEVQDRGAGEVVLNCMGSDGVGTGYDLAQLKAARDVLTIPLVASGGAGALWHFVEVFRQTDVDGALAAGVFHRGEMTVGQVRQAVRDAGVEVRS